MAPRWDDTWEGKADLEIEDADDDLAFGVGAGGGQRAAVGHHGLARHRHAHHRALLVRFVLKSAKQTQQFQFQSINRDVISSLEFLATGSTTSWTWKHWIRNMNEAGLL